MYLPELNSIHETRDVQWSKRMYFTPVKEKSIHAVDSVELMVNMQGIPLRTIASVTPHQMHTQGTNVIQAKGPVAFQQKVEYIPQEMDFDDREADWKAYGAPKEIEIKLDREDLWSRASGSNKARRQKATGQYQGQE
jgi:hypothetical protein